MKTTLIRVLGAAAAVAVTGAAVVVLDKVLKSKDPLKVEQVEFPEKAEDDPEAAAAAAEACAEAEAEEAEAETAPAEGTAEAPVEAAAEEPAEEPTAAAEDVPVEDEGEKE